MTDAYAEFQSPRNRVKCSVNGCRWPKLDCRRSFNPLEIGSSVLCADRRWLLVLHQDSFNPLEIGSSVLWRGNAYAFETLTFGFNPLEIGSSVLCRQELEAYLDALTFQSPRNRVKCSVRHCF